MVHADSQRRRSSRILRASMSVVTGFSILARLAAVSGVRKRLERIDGVKDRRDRLALGIAELGPPHVKDEYRSKLAFRVPRLMLDAVVEDQQLAFFPLASLVADTQPASLGDDQRKVADHSTVQHSEVRGNVRAASEPGEERHGRSSAYVSQRQSLQRFDGAWTARRILFDELAFLP